MTTAEALAVVREALDTYVEDVVPDEGFCDPWYAALALIENQLAYYKVSSDGRSAAVTRAEKAEDDLIGALLAIETWTRREQKQYERVRELEAALRFYGQASDASLLKDAGRIARRALGGGE